MRAHENDPQVVARVAATLADRREEGIPEAELVALAELEGIWPFQVMEALGLSLQAGGIFRPKPPRKPQEEPEEGPRYARTPPPVADLVVQLQPEKGGPVRVHLDKARAEAPTRIEWTEATLGQPVPPAESSPGRAAALAPARGGRWPERLQAAVAEQWPDATEWPSAEVVIAQERMEALGWPASSWKHPAFWGATHEAGKAARSLGWDPTLVDGRGLRLRRRAS